MEVTIGSEKFLYEEATVSASALYFMKSIYEDHLLNESLQFIPHCGFNIFKRDNSETVDIIGCPLGIDWSVYHANGNIKIMTESKKTVTISKKYYIQEVFKFADEVQRIYEKSLDKILPTTQFEVESYQTFWKEWFRLRDNKY